MIEWDTENLPLNKLYGVQIGYEDNAITTKFDSGREISVAKTAATGDNTR